MLVDFIRRQPFHFGPFGQGKSIVDGLRKDAQKFKDLFHPGAGNSPAQTPLQTRRPDPITTPLVEEQLPRPRLEPRHRLKPRRILQRMPMQLPVAPRLQSKRILPHKRNLPPVRPLYRPKPTPLLSLPQRLLLPLHRTRLRQRRSRLRTLSSLLRA
ncbi:unnamed protein product [Mycena citricolor]|uniref:Uncharacterized protein n=1 Tax=Mycena citricolor TaxID=2018698 RepID=A0AAD2HSU5_9AGAR|nr:unnamed protein product [Mycena citricolor]